MSKGEIPVPGEDKLLRDNYGLVIEAIKRWGNKGIPAEDIGQEAAQGLLYAIREFDGTKSMKFSTWAIKIINLRCKRALMEKSRLIRLPYAVERQNIKQKKLTGKPIESIRSSIPLDTIPDVTKSYSITSEYFWHTVASIPQMPAHIYYILKKYAFLDEKRCRMRRLSEICGIKQPEVVRYLKKGYRILSDNKNALVASLEEIT